MIIDPFDPIGPAAGVYRVYRVYRGGYWLSDGNGPQAASRERIVPFYQGYSCGFRLTVTLPCKTTTPVVQ